MLEIHRSTAAPTQDCTNKIRDLLIGLFNQLLELLILHDPATWDGVPLAVKGAPEARANFSMPEI